MRRTRAIRIGVAAAVGLLFAVGCSILTDLDPLTNGHGPAALDSSAFDAPGTDAPSGSDGPVAPGDGQACDAGYREMVIQDKPVAYWRLGDPPGGTRASDESGNGNHGTYFGGIELGKPGAIACDPNQAIENDGTGVIRVDDQLHFTDTAPLTLEAWAAFQDGTPTFVGKASYSLYWWSDGLRFDRQQSTTSHCACIAFEGDGGALRDGRYHHFVGTYDSFTMKVYVDGVMIRSNCECTLTIPADAGTLVVAGIAGKLDEVAIYDKALTTQAIQAHFAARAP